VGLIGHINITSTCTYNTNKVKCTAQASKTTATATATATVLYFGLLQKSTFCWCLCIRNLDKEARTVAYVSRESPHLCPVLLLFIY
jgi:hypothetical protein